MKARNARKEPAAGAIRVVGARAHNLARIDVEIPHAALTVVTGPSGSGKSSLAFDVVHAEAERRYLAAHGEGLVLAPPAVDNVEGLLPALAVRQTPPRLGARATVATLAQLAEPLRTLFHRYAAIQCPRCGAPLRPLARAEIVDAVLALPEGTRLTLSAPLHDRGWQAPSHDVEGTLDELHRRGFSRLVVDGKTVDLDPRPSLVGTQSVDLLIDRLVARSNSRARIAESVELALREGRGVCRVIVASEGAPIEGTLYADRARCTRCALEVPPIDARTFSHTSTEGACPACRGTGEVLAVDAEAIVPDPERSIEEGAIAVFGEPGSVRYRARLASLKAALDPPLDVPFSALPEPLRQVILFGGALKAKGKKKETAYEGVVPLLTRRLAELDARVDSDEDVWTALEEELGAFRSTQRCPMCDGARLGVIGRTATLFEATLSQLLALDVPHLEARVRSWAIEGMPLAEPLTRALLERLALLSRVGLGYLVVDRAARTLSAGEAQRIRLAEVLGSALDHLLYVLDEPTQGLHPRDVAQILEALLDLRGRSGTLLVVEHDRQIIEAADHLIELGPGAGREGGRLVGQGTLATLRAENTLTARWLDAAAAREAPRRSGAVLTLEGATLHNLRGDAVTLTRRALNVICGVSGSGKSSLLTCIEDRARAIVFTEQHPRRTARIGRVHAGELIGASGLMRVLALDESPMGRGARSTPATFLGVLGPLRDLFVQLPEARARGWDSARFTYNVAGGRCERCSGDGVLEVRVLGTIQEIPCPLCHGSRYERETLEVRWRGMSIADVLALSIEEALRQFESIPAVVKRLGSAARVGLGYLALGQRAGTLSGGEAQRLALARELGQGGAGETLYLLDEPTRGLHGTDVDALTDVLQALVEEGNTVVVAAHALALVRAADRVIELGPAGGPGGGQVIFSGRPEDLATKDTATGEALRR
jgi:excinuclease ABC subunit A